MKTFAAVIGWAGIMFGLFSNNLAVVLAGVAWVGVSFVIEPAPREKL